MATGIGSYSKTAADNSNASSEITLSDSMAPNAVDNTQRQIMADVAEFRDDIGGALTTAGGTTTYTLTTNGSVSSLADGRMVAVVWNATNTGASTLNVDSLGAKAVYRNGGDGMVAVVAGELVIQTHGTLRYDASAAAAAGAWVLVDPLTNVGLFRAPDIILQDQKTSGTAGGTFTSGARRTSDLNTEVRDVRGECALATNQFTLTAGTWFIQWWRPGFGCDGFNSWLVNATDTADILIGRVTYSGSAGNYAQADSMGSGVFTIAASKALEIQARCVTTKASTGFGVPASLSVETYTVVHLWRMA